MSLPHVFYPCPQLNNMYPRNKIYFLYNVTKQAAKKPKEMTACMLYLYSFKWEFGKGWAKSPL